MVRRSRAWRGTAARAPARRSRAVGHRGGAAVAVDSLLAAAAPRHAAEAAAAPAPRWRCSLRERRRLDCSRRCDGKNVVTLVGLLSAQRYPNLYTHASIERMT